MAQPARPVPGTYEWTSPLPWCGSGKMWSVSLGHGGAVLSLDSRYHWCDHHVLLRVKLKDDHPGWIWRTRDGRDVLLAVKEPS